MKLKRLTIDIKILIISAIFIGAIGFMEQYRDDTNMTSRSPGSFLLH